MEITRKKLLRLGAAALALAGGAGLLLWLRPPCPILRATGYYCGACGVTRMVEELFQGHVAAAFWENPYMFVALPLAGLWLLGEAVCFLWGRKPLLRRRWMVPLLLAVAAVGVAFTVLRNLPGWEVLRPV